MNNSKAIELLNSQYSKIEDLNEKNYRSWQVHTSSLIRDLFGDTSEEYKYISEVNIVLGYTDIPFQTQINSYKADLQIFIDGCIESVEHRSVFKPDKQNNGGDWAKNHPILMELIKTVFLLAAGFALRYFSEPKGIPKESKTNTEQSPSTLSK